MNVKTFEILQSVDSTNNHAMKKARNGEVEGWTSFFALEQTKGKGQRQKIWESTPGENIIMSTVADCKALTLGGQFHLSCITAFSCYNLLKKYGGDEFSIKWPNDIYWRDRKAGGILIENIITGDSWSKAIIGTGININQTSFGEMGKKAVSLKQITGKNFDPILLAQELSTMLFEAFQQMHAQPISYHLEQFNQVLYRKGMITRFKRDHQVFEAEVKEVSSHGELILFHGMNLEIPFGSIEWLD